MKTKPNTKAEIERLRAEALNKLATYLPGVVDSLIELALKAKDESVRREACGVVLSSLGIKDRATLLAALQRLEAPDGP